MKYLPIREIGVDDVPLDGSEIMLIESKTSFGMFESFSTQEHEVVWMYGDIADTWEEAREKGARLTFKPEEVDSSDLLIPVHAGDWCLVEGMLWTYSHEFCSLVGVFPFQNRDQYNLALRAGWIKELEYVTDDREWHTENGRDIRFDESVVEWDGKVIDIKWCGDSVHEWQVRSDK